jgi:hypothetical protein
MLSLDMGNVLVSEQTLSSSYIRNTQQLNEIVLEAYRANENTQENIEEAFRLLRALNEKGAELDKSYQQRLTNQKDDVLSKRIFTVGDVVVHTETGTRCVVTGWRVDEKTGEQYLALLVDQMDAHEYLRAGHPLLSQPSLEPIEDGGEDGQALGIDFGQLESEDGTLMVDLDDLDANLGHMGKANIESVQKALRNRQQEGGGVNAKEFARVTDPALQRICNEARSPSIYFDGFDAVSGKFIPGSDLLNVYPADVAPVDGSRSEEELRARLQQEKERTAVVLAVAALGTEVATGLRAILAEQGLDGDGGPPQDDSDSNSNKFRGPRGDTDTEHSIARDIVEEVRLKIDELAEVSRRLKDVADRHDQAGFVPALEALLDSSSSSPSSSSSSSSSLPPSDVSMASSIVEDNTVFRALNLLTTVHQGVDHMLELRFQDRGRGCVFCYTIVLPPFSCLCVMSLSLSYPSIAPCLCTLWHHMARV